MEKTEGIQVGGRPDNCGSVSVKGGGGERRVGRVLWSKSE